MGGKTFKCVPKRLAAIRLWGYEELNEASSDEQTLRATQRAMREL